MEKGLKEMTLGELLDSKEFQEELQRQIDNEVEHHDKMMREAYGKGLRLQRNPQERLRERGVFNVEDMVAAYKLIACKALQGYSAEERDYIKRVCWMAYWRIVDKEKKKEKK